MSWWLASGLGAREMGGGIAMEGTEVERSEK
jgi:hypothetical protein